MPKHPPGRISNSDSFLNRFIMVVHEKFFYFSENLISKELLKVVPMDNHFKTIYKRFRIRYSSAGCESKAIVIKLRNAYGIPTDTFNVLRIEQPFGIQFLKLIFKLSF